MIPKNEDNLSTKIASDKKAPLLDVSGSVCIHVEQPTVVKVAKGIILVLAAAKFLGVVITKVRIRG